MTYHGSTRAGYVTPPGAGDEVGIGVSPPLPLDEIASAATAPAVGIGTVFADLWDFSPTMLQPVGGMDTIAHAFARAVPSTIKYHAEVVRMRRAGGRAQVTWRDRRTNRQQLVDADFVICTAPLTVLKDIDSDFSEPLKNAIKLGATLYVPAVKIAFHAGRRWWESDQQLYGGISWTARDITQVWYPAHGFGANGGIVVGAYIWSNDIGQRFAAMAPDRRHTSAMADAERLHPGYSTMVDRAVSVAWSKVPFTLGGWIEWDADARKEAYPVLLQGDGPFYFAGEHMSYNTGWQEGAVQSAHHTVKEIAERVRTGRRADRPVAPPRPSAPPFPNLPR
jgi:monoamine oxidase